MCRICTEKPEETQDNIPFVCRVSFAHTFANECLLIHLAIITTFRSRNSYFRSTLPFYLISYIALKKRRYLYNFIRVRIISFRELSNYLNIGICSVLERYIYPWITHHHFHSLWKQIIERVQIRKETCSPIALSLYWTVYLHTNMMFICTTLQYFY